MSKEFWNDRFSSVEYIYDTEQNEFFKEYVDKNHSEKLFLLGEGEGRLSAEERNQIHKRIITSIKSGGKMILEDFNKNQIKNFSGGLKDINSLLGENNLLESFLGIEILFLQSLGVELNEENPHKSKADVICFIGMKK